jgi:hypothetical protein
MAHDILALSVSLCLSVCVYVCVCVCVCVCVFVFMWSLNKQPLLVLIRCIFLLGLLYPRLGSKLDFIVSEYWRMESIYQPLSRAMVTLKNLGKYQFQAFLLASVVCLKCFVWSSQSQPSYLQCILLICMTVYILFFITASVTFGE